MITLGKGFVKNLYISISIMNPSNEPQKTTIDAKVYLDYIDKEMTFCGIITTFSLACVLFMTDKLLSKPEASIGINFKSFYFIAVLIALTVSAFLLFLQRSRLANRYGQISLETAQPDFTGKTIAKWLEEVDAWKFWYPYLYAITLIKCAFIEIFILLLITLFKEYQVFQFLNQYSFVISLAIVLIGIAIEYIYCHRLLGMPHEKSLGNFPHYKVYTRIGVSILPNAGVGIIAITKIPKDEYIFFPDDDEIVWVGEERVDNVPDNIKRLYKDFCIKEDNLYGCPVNFNKLTPAWYLNCNPTSPNVYCDKDFRFKALRDIDEGEELTADYSKYSKV